LISFRLTMEIDSAVEQRLKFTNQTHLIQFWSELNSEQRQILLHDIGQVDFDRVQQAFQTIRHELNDETKKDEPSELIDDVMEPIPSHLAGSIDGSTDEQLNFYRQRGLKAIAEGSVCVLLLAGGQGTRLGVDYPKGMFDVDLPSKKSLYQIQAERIQRLEQTANETFQCQTAKIPWFIMTSEHTQQQTRNYFQNHNYFGLEKENLILFEQKTLPALDYNGRILLEEKFRLTKAADGNGGLYRALKTRGVLDEMSKRGIRYVHVYCVDNILVRLADPIFIGFCLEKNADCAAKVVKKTSPNEAVGVICKVRDCFQVVEYSEISEQTANRRNNEELLFNAGNICNHFFTFDFLHDVCSKHENQLRYHVAKKKIPSIDSKGNHVKTDGIKLEKFVFDVFPFSKNFAVWEVRRDEEFSPLKNGSGLKDTPSTCRRDLMNLHLRWLEKAGAQLPTEISKNVENSTKICEISPLVSYSGENLEFVKGKIFEFPIFIEMNFEEKKPLVGLPTKNSNLNEISSSYTTN